MELYTTFDLLKLSEELQMSPNNYIFTRTFVFVLYCTHRVCVAQPNMKICINFTGIVWLASPVAIALSVLQANVAFVSLLHGGYTEYTRNIKLTQG